MSRIYWHSPSEPAAELRGSERAYLGSLGERVGLGIMRIYGWTDSDGPLWTIVDPKARAYQTRNDYDLDMYFRGILSDGPFVDIVGRQVDISYAIMNTAIQIGDKPLGLGVRLHGNCESHLWVDGPNRAWLAGIIERGRATGMYREDMGWESVIELLRKRDDEPVVTSFSVTDQFPNYRIAQEGGRTVKPTLEQWEEYGEEARYIAFDEMPAAARWDICMEVLRARGAHYELRPDNWHEVHYDHLMGSEKIYTVFDVLEEAERRHREQHPERYAGYRPPVNSGVDSAPAQ